MNIYVSFLTLTALLGWASALPQEDNPTLSVSEPFTDQTTSYTTVTVIASVPPPPPTQPQSPEPSPGPSVATDGPACACGATYCGRVLEQYLSMSNEHPPSLLNPPSSSHPCLC